MVAVIIGDIAVVLALAALLGAAARRCGQPTVVGQILAGVLLSPSALGRLPGHLTTRLFPPQAVPYLTVLSQVAVVIFMFAVGYEIDLRTTAGRSRAVPLIAASALLVPMGFGAGSAWLLGHVFVAAAGENAHGRSFVTFMAAAMSITALPVLAAIVRERGIVRSRTGATATAAAGIMDVAAWLVLAAALIGLPHHAARPLAVTLLLTVSFVVVMVFAVRPAIAWWLGRPGALLAQQAPAGLILAMLSAWISASIGLHAVFGGFLAGLVMRGKGREPDADLLRVTEEAGGILLPLFFAVTGLSLNLSLLTGDRLIVLVLLVAVACGTKMGPAYAASRLSGLRPRESGEIAVLLNTRGLTELIALQVGLDAGIIGQALFTVLVIMALATTLMTGPLLSLLSRERPASPPGHRRSSERAEQPPAAAAGGTTERAATEARDSFDHGAG